MKLTSFVVFLLGIALWSSSVFARIPMGPETLLSVTTGGWIACLAILSSFSGTSFLRYANLSLGALLILSPVALLLTEWNYTAAMIQVIVGLLVVGISLLGQGLKQGGGWRRVLRSPSDESYRWS